MIERIAAAEHYSSVDFIVFINAPRSARSRLMERHLANCDKCRARLARFMRQ